MSRDIGIKAGIAAASLGIGALAGHFLPKSLMPDKVDNGAVNYAVKELGLHLTIEKGKEPESVEAFRVTLEQPGSYEISVSQPGNIHGVMNDRIDVVTNAQSRYFDFAHPVHDAIFTIVRLDSQGEEHPVLYASTRGARFSD